MRTSFLLTAGLLLIVPGIALAQGTDFVPLTTLPGIDTVASSGTLAVFLTNIYKICIGLAAVLAVLQIMRAGVMYMGGDSITEKKEARELITMSVVGLLLVLSPTIVFSIINPKILNLDINVGSLESSLPNSPTFTGANNALWTNTTDRSAAQTLCSSQGGTTHFTCQPTGGGAAHDVAITQACASGETGVNVCLPGAGSAAQSADMCTAQYLQITAVSGSSCNGSTGYVAVPRGCCAGISSGGTCCAIPKGISNAVLWNDGTTARSGAESKCTADGGVATFTCQVSGSGAARTVPITEACKTGEIGITVCKTP